MRTFETVARQTWQVLTDGSTLFVPSRSAKILDMFCTEVKPSLAAGGLAVGSSES